MRNLKLRYYLVNIVVLLATAVLFILDYGNVHEIFLKVDFFRMLVIALTVVIVHTVKAGRLYIAICGSEISLSRYLEVYCKVTPVSMIFPLKMGEFFRMYCYGQQFKNNLKGIVIVLFDRFMDTAALVTMILLLWTYNGGHITSFVSILLVFLVFIILTYFAFPGIYSFWKSYILKAKATERRLLLLGILDKLNLVYMEITNVSKGRGMILYFLSLIAWVVEIGSVSIVNRHSKDIDINQKVSEYLISAMGSTQTLELRQFVFFSVVFMITIYIVVKILELLFRKRGRQ